MQHDEQELLKIATRAWRVNLSELTSKSQQRLRNSGIINYSRDAEGLNRGTDNIASKLGLSTKEPQGFDFGDYGKALGRRSNLNSYIDAKKINPSTVKPQHLGYMSETQFDLRKYLKDKVKSTKRF